MLLKRKKSLTDTNKSSSSLPNKASCSFVKSTTSSSLFRPGAKILVRKAPLFVSSFDKVISKTFQQPRLKQRRGCRNDDTRAQAALVRTSLGPKRRMNGMAKLMARAGKGLAYKVPVAKRKRGSGSSDTEEETDEEEEEKEPEKPFEPLCLWVSPHQGGKAKGLPGSLVKQMRCDEFGIEEEVSVLAPAPLEHYSKQSVFVPTALAKILREHQREGVQFMYECVMGLKDEFAGNGCILADDMGLGKTLQSVALIYTLLKTGITAKAGSTTAKRVIIVCPCSLVKNWDNEFVKWLGPGTVKSLALTEGDRKTMVRNIESFTKTRIFNILILSYECIRTHIGLLTKSEDSCDLLVCDEAHRLKNSENQTSRALNSLPCRRRVLLTGTPMQNDLQEFYAMVNFTNRGVLGSAEEFRRRLLFPILRGREPDATDLQKQRMLDMQNELFSTVGAFILRRINTLNAEHLPPKLVQVVCINLTDIQQNMYQHLVSSKDTQHILDGKQVNCLSSIQMLMKLSNHPSLVVEDDAGHKKKTGGRSQTVVKYCEDDNKESTAAPGADGIAKFLPHNEGGRGKLAPVHPEWSGKMYVLFRLMKEMRKPGNGNDKIVIISNYTQTLDLIGRMCRENSWGSVRLDGSVSMKKRQKMVDEFNDPSSSLVAFLLSSKAGGCGLNLIGGNRLVLFDPDWNPAVDKQAAARCWRDGQKKRCFTYRFLATGTVEEKIFQRQLSKEGLQSVVDDKEQVNALSTKDLKNLFKLRHGTPSDTHDKLRCKRCKIIHDSTEMEAGLVLPKKLAACRTLLNELTADEDAKFFLKPLDATQHGTTKENYEKFVKQPMDFETIRKKLNQPPGVPSAYSSVSGFSKDVNRIFSNVVKVWDDGDDIVDTAKRLQVSWLSKWTELVPILMCMTADNDKKEENDDDDEPKKDAVDELLETCASLGNERGEDYQEQIGMPDEENMRHWSHHYKTETVDDPIFRAAMRGTDNVSFIFGLEVTWSNIQARQQEEEEAAAMECDFDGVDFKPAAGENGAQEASDEEASADNNPSKQTASTKAAAAVDDDGKVVKQRSAKTKSLSADAALELVDSDDEMKDFIEEDGKEDGDAASNHVAEAVHSDSDGDDEEEETADAMTESDAEGSEGGALVDSEDEGDPPVSRTTNGHALLDSDDEEEHGVLADSNARGGDDLLDSEQEDPAETGASQEDSDDSAMATPKEKAPSNSSGDDIVDSLASVDPEEPSSPSVEAAANLSPDSVKSETIDEMFKASGEEIAPAPSDSRLESIKTASADSSPNVKFQSGDLYSESSVSPDLSSRDPSPPKKKKAKTVASEWECGACTLVNKAKARKCAVCGEKKPVAKREKGARLPSQSSV